MPAREIAGRVAGRWGLRRLERFARAPEQLASRVAGSERAVLEACQRLVPGTAPNQLQSFAERHPTKSRELAEHSKKIADAIAAGTYTLLGRPIGIPTNIDWHADPLSGFAWEQAFFKRVSYHRIPAHVDFKHVWEVGRHQYVVELSRAGLLNGSKEHLDLAQQVLGDWTTKNPFCRGIHWTSGLEVAMRAISWIWTLANAKAAWERDASVAQLVGQLSLHGHYLENHLSIYSSPYNHVIGEATALYLLGSVFHDTSSGERWQSKGRELLHRFGTRQFYQDGFCVEQAVGYHYYTLGFLTLAMLAAQANGDGQLELADLLRKGFRAGLAMRQPSGDWPAIGDVDSASSIPVARDNFWDFSPLHQLAATALSDPSLGCQSESASGELYWLLGVNGVEQWQTLQKPAAEHSVAVLPDAGYYIARGGADWLLLDAGPIAAGLHTDDTPSVAHGHADTLQVLAHWGGQVVLRDAGMPNYAGNAQRMDHFRSPAAHNTVGFEDAAVVRPAGRLAWSHDVTRTELRWSEDQGVWRACGTVRWKDCSITRHVLAIPGEAIWIADSLATDICRRAHWSWQLASDDWAVIDRSDRHVALSAGALQMRCVVGSGDLICDLTGPDGEGCAGWYSPGYGILHPGRVLRLQLPLAGPTVVLHALGTPQRKVGFINDIADLWLASEIAEVRPSLDTLSKLESEYDSLGCGTWRLS